MKKLLLLLLLIPVQIKGLSVESVYIDTEIDISGTLQVKELIKVTNQNDDFKLNIFYKDTSLKDFKSNKDSLLGSKIYNGSSVEVLKAGIVKDEYDYKDIYAKEFEENVTFFDEIDAEDKKEYYQITLNKKNKDTMYYIKYNVYNVAVEHNDCAEVYYKFMKHFNYDAKEVKILLHTAHHSDLFEVWAHGNNNAIVTKDTESSVMMSEITNYKKNTYIDNRVIFDKDLFMININKSKKSGIDAVKLIKEIENERNENTTTKNYLLISFISLMALTIIIVIVYLIRKKHNKVK